MLPPGKLTAPSSSLGWVGGRPWAQDCGAVLGASPVFPGACLCRSLGPLIISAV